MTIVDQLLDIEKIKKDIWDAINAVYAGGISENLSFSLYPNKIWDLISADTAATYFASVVGEAAENLSALELAIGVLRYKENIESFDIGSSHGAIENSIEYLAWSPNGRYLAVAMGQLSFGEVILSYYPIVYEKTTDKLVRLPDISSRNASYILGMEWSPDSRYLAVGYPFNPSVRIYDFITGASIENLDVPSYRYFGAIKWSPNGRYLAVDSSPSPADYESYLTVFDWVSGSPVAVPNIIDIRTGGDNRCIAWSPDGRYLAVTAELSGTEVYLILFDFISVNPVRLPDIDMSGMGLHNSHRELSWSPDNRYLLAVSRGNVIKMFSFISDNIVRMPDISISGLDYAEWSADGRYLTAMYAISSSYFPTRTGVVVFDCVSVTPVEVFSQEFINTVKAIAWSPNGYYLAVGAELGEFLTIYDFTYNPPAIVSSVEMNNSVDASLAWSPDGCYLAVGVSSKTNGSRFTVYHAADITVYPAQLMEAMYKVDSVGYLGWGFVNNPTLQGEKALMQIVLKESFTHPSDIKLIWGIFQKIRDCINQVLQELLLDEVLIKNELFDIYSNYLMRILEQIQSWKMSLESIRQKINNVFTWIAPEIRIPLVESYNSYSDYIDIIEKKNHHWVMLLEQMRKAINHQGVFVSADEPYDVFPERILAIRSADDSKSDISASESIEIRYSQPATEDIVTVLEGESVGISLRLINSDGLNVLYVESSDILIKDNIQFFNLKYADMYENVIIEYLVSHETNIENNISFGDLKQINTSESTNIAYYEIHNISGSEFIDINDARQMSIMESILGLGRDE